MSYKAYIPNKASNTLRCEPSSPQSAKCRKSRVISAIHIMTCYQLSNISFTSDNPGNVHPSEFSLLWGLRDVQLAEYPFIKWPVIFKFYRA